MNKSIRAWLARHRVSALGNEASLAVIRAGFRLGEWVAPHLAGRVGQGIWFRVPPAPPIGRRDRGLPQATPVEVAVEGRRLNVLSWGEGPVVLLVHGWSGWWQQMGVYVEPLVAAGFRVVAWDAPSHGESAPGRATFCCSDLRGSAATSAIGKLLTIRGFLVGEFGDKAPEFAQRMAGWLCRGRVWDTKRNRWTKGPWQHTLPHVCPTGVLAASRNCTKVLVNAGFARGLR